MIKLESEGFPSPYLDCYQSSILNILRYMGLSDELAVMVEPSYFILDREKLSVSSQVTASRNERWRKRGLEVESRQISDQAYLRQGLMDKLDNGFPVCVPVDIYFLSFTSHFRQFHIEHYLNIFGYNNTQYYVISPYYRYQGWVDIHIIHNGFFSPANPNKSLLYVPKLTWQIPAVEEIQKLIKESCEYMLGLAVPEELINYDSQNIGLSGMLSLAACLKDIAVIKKHSNLQPKLVTLATQISEIGYSRYWLYKLLQQYREDLAFIDVTSWLDELFSIVVPTWRAIGMRYGASVYASNYNSVVEQTVQRIQSIHAQENKLFNKLLCASQGYEEGFL